LQNHGGLKKAPPPSVGGGGGGGGGRGDLLSQIAQGVKLKSVDPNEVRVSSVKKGEGGLTDLLSEALNNFRENVAVSSDEEEEEDDDSDWSDTSSS